MQAISITILLLAAAACHVVATFTSACSVWYVHGHETLTTECQTWDPVKGKILTNLDLNNCIGVDTGSNAMVWMTGGNAFTIHCRNCSLQNSEVVMQCECIDPQTGNKTSSSINLDDGITNQHDGSLTCP
ncbi:hypothetical protein VM1G_02879 [Cytospora mali]|uniref:Cyanovirin-N domain-containing protein n=1 Tax=Cytospora mali TaxID=578113 RepID=A0A194VU79_CYTMA|nr:hypothetical protein VM1G_02881 [Valsa mali]KUI67552.1 hypothetical protein VM1G_02879 [Valsa mali]